MKLTRCDQCRRLSDEEGVGYVGRNHEVRFYKELILTITAQKDYCGSCVKKLIADHTVREANEEDY